MPRPRALALALLLPSLLALGGCGGVSKDEYADDLDRVCQDIEEKTKAIGEAKADNSADLSAQLEDIRGAIRDGIDRMQRIERPDGEAGEKGEEYVAKLDQTLNRQVLPALDDLEAAVRAKDQAKIRAAAQRLQAIDEEDTDRLAKELGAEGCAKG